MMATLHTVKESHQSVHLTGASMRKLQEQNESHQASRAKMAEGMALALEKKDQEWMERMAVVEQEKTSLSARLDEMMEQSLSLFQKRDDLDELEGFQQQELAKVKHMLLRKEELLSHREREIQQREAELLTARKGLAEAQEKLQNLGEQHEESCRLNTELEIEREELLEVREEAEKKIGELERRGQDLQKIVQQVSEDFQKSQRSLRTLQTEHDALKLCQQKAAVTDEDKERMLLDLQEKVSSLERRLQGNFSQDDHMQEMLKEKCALEQRLEETRVELLEARTNHADTASSLEAQISKTTNSVTELQTLLRHKEESSKSYRERTDAQIAGLEQQLLESSDKLKTADLQISDKQAHLVKLQAEWTAEQRRLQHQVCVEQQQGEERAVQLQEQLAALRTEKETEHSSAQSRISELEQERSSLVQGVEDADLALKTRTEELEQARAELNSRQTVSVEIAMALEDTRRQKEELQLQVRDLTESLQKTEQELAEVNEQLKHKEEELQTLRNELQVLQEERDRLHATAEEKEVEKDSQLASLRQEVISQTQQLDSCQSRVSDLEVEVESLTEQLQGPEVSEPDQNGTVTVDDLDHMQNVNKDLEQQLIEKNKTIKQLQQRLAELKRTLQKELKLKPDPETDGKEKSQEGRAEKAFSEPPLASVPAPSPAPTAGLGTITPNTTVTNTSDLNDSREINFEYLKHVVLKFMSSREAEAFQLIRAVSVLLNFTREEEDMLKQTLEYKMSWFGSKPSPRGIARPSISGPSGVPSHWS